MPRRDRRPAEVDQPVKTVDRKSEHLHKFAALLAKISFEEQFQIRVEFEESCVEELGGGLSDRATCLKLSCTSLICSLVMLTSS